MLERGTIAVTANMPWVIWNYRRGTLQALIDAGYSVVTISPSNQYSEKMQAMGCKHIDLPISQRGMSPISEAAIMMRLRQIYSRIQPNVVLSYTIKNNLYTGLVLNKKNSLLVPNVSGLGTAFQTGKLMSSAVIAAYKLAFNAVPFVLFQNPEDRDQFVEAGILSDDRTVILPGSGVDLKYFTPSHRAKSATGALTFIMACRMLWKKGVKEFVDAAAHVKDIYPNARFQLLGFPVDDPAIGATRDQLQHWVSDGNIEFIEPVDDVRPFLDAADVKVLPSEYAEGTPKCLLEALGMATAIITTDRPGCRRVLDAGENGYFCAPKNAASVAEVMLQMLGLPDEKLIEMQRHSRRKAEREFDEKIVIDTYLELIDNQMRRQRLAA